MNTKPYGEIFQTVVESSKFDSKNRQIGYIIVFRDNGTDFRSYVQNARRIGKEWQEFGVRQRSKSFTSQKAATTWAYATAKERISKL